MHSFNSWTTRNPRLVEDLVITAVLLVMFVVAPGIVMCCFPKEKPPDWTPSGDPLTTMSHHNALICWDNNQEYLPVDQSNLLVRWMPGAAGDHVFLYPSSRGECGVLPLSQFGLNPVSVQIQPTDADEYHHYLVTTWSPTHKAEPDPPYDWTTTEMTEWEGSWWMTFTFSSSNQSRPVVDIRVE